jgi:hypothetical protein
MMKSLLTLLFVGFLIVVPIAVPQLVETVVVENDQDAEMVVLDNAETTVISIEWSVLDSALAADEEEEFWDWVCRALRWLAGGSHGY